jgi:hypothetical protein
MKLHENPFCFSLMALSWLAGDTSACLAADLIVSAEIKHLTLYNLSTAHAPVLDKIPIAVLFAILLSRGAAQKHDGKHYSRKISFENRVGLHYSHFRVFSRSPYLENQSLTP